MLLALFHSKLSTSDITFTKTLFKSMFSLISFKISIKFFDNWDEHQNASRK